MENKASREKGISALKQMHVMKPCIDAFADGKLWMSTGGGMMSGILFEAEPDIIAKAKELEDKGHTVWHVIKGRYIVTDGSVVDMNTYLVGEPESIGTLGEAECLAYSENVTDPGLSDLGYVIVQSRNGGICRVC